MRSKNKSLSRLVVLLLVSALLVLAGCGSGGGDGGSPSTSPAPSNGGQAPGTGADTPKYGGVLNATFSVDAAHFDPHRGTAAQNYVSLTYNTLVRYKTGHEVQVTDFILEPDLAERWEQPDDTTYIFYLRKGVKFHDKPPVNGRELTADDVVFTFERMLADDPENIRRGQYAMIESVEALDSHTVKITLSEPFAPFLSTLATVFASVLPRADVDFKTTVIGTGPFMLDEVDKGVKYVYNKHPEYYEDGKPYLDGIVLHIIPDMSARLAALRGKQVDVVDLVTYQQAKPVLDADPSLGWEKWPGNFSVMVRLNTLHKPLDDPRVRQALSLGLDREAIARALGGGEGVVNGPVPTALGDWAVNPSELPGFTRDVEKAKQLLAEAGYPDGLTLNALGGSTPDNRKIMLEAMAGQWADIGVTLNIRLIPATEVNGIRVSKEFELLADNLTIGADPDNYLYVEYHSESSGNIGSYSDPVLDELLDQQRREMDETKRRELLVEAQKRVAENAFILTSGDPIYTSIWQPYVGGFRHSYINQYLPLKDVWLNK